MPAPPARSRRRQLITGFAAGVAAAAVAAAIVVAVRPAAQPLRYTSVPAPCDMVGAVTLARYLPEAKVGEMTASSGRPDQAGGCSWSSVTDSESRNLALRIDAYGSSDGLTAAQRAYDAERRAGCACRGQTVVAQAVPGLGDQATAAFVTVQAAAAKGLVWNVPQVYLTVRSGNAVVILVYSVDPGLNAPPKPANATLLADTVAMARDVMAALAGHPAAATAPSAPAPAASAPASPHALLYASPRDPCRLVRASTLARYMPGASVDRTRAPAAPSPGLGAGGPHVGTCYWDAPQGSMPTGQFLALTLTVYATPADAQQAFQVDVQTPGQDQSGTPRPVKGLGGQAAAQVDGGDFPGMDLFTAADNVVIETSYSATATFGPVPGRAAMLAVDVAVTRDVLAHLPRS